jgi:hypothetical protein
MEASQSVPDCHPPEKMSCVQLCSAQMEVTRALNLCSNHFGRLRLLLRVHCCHRLRSWDTRTLALFRHLNVL